MQGRGWEQKEEGLRRPKKQPCCRLTLATQRPVALHTWPPWDIQAPRKDHSDDTGLAGRGLRATQDRSAELLR